MKEEEQHSIRLETSMEFDQGRIPSTKRWTKIAYRLICKEELPSTLRIDALLDKSPLRGTRTFEFFISKLREWNRRVKAGTINKKDEQLFSFLYSHLLTIAVKDEKLQLVLIQRLFSWFQDSINPKPKMSEILKKLKKKSSHKGNEDDLVRKTFSSNLSLSINNFYRRQIARNVEEKPTKQFPGERDKQAASEQRMIIRLHHKEQENLRIWREKEELNTQIKQVTGCRSRREEQFHKSMPTFRKIKTVNSSHRPLASCREQSAASPITGLTLITNPFERFK